MQRRKFMSSAIGLGALAAFWPAHAARTARRSGTAFGTVVSVQVWHPDARRADAAVDAAFSAMQKVDAVMSLYRDTSDVHRLNRLGRLARPDPHLLAVLTEASRVSALTRGAFDITVQPLWPGGGVRGDATRLVGWRRLRVDAHEVRLLRPGMAITLNGIAQGYAADLALAAVRAHGVEHALIDAGEFASLGDAPDGQPWRLAIRDPRDAGVPAGVVPLDGRCLATSGDYETAFSVDFSSHHIVDPHTGKSPAELASATVAAPTAMLADALSTACMVLGRERSLALAARLPGVDVFMIDKQGRHTRSTGFPDACA